MHRRIPILLVSGLSVVCALTVAALAQSKEERVSLEQVPAAVKATILREAAGAEIKEIELETENGKQVYEAEFVRNGKMIEISVAPNGTLLETEGENGGDSAKSKQGAEAQEQEREVAEAEVPAAALATLKRLAGQAKLTEFAEEIEHGSTFYEGSWKNEAGHNIDALVTPEGYIVEIEEHIPINEVPPSVLEAAKKLAGKDAQFYCEKTTVTLYELKFRKDGKRYEVLFTTDGRAVEKEIEEGDEDEDD